jgi:arylamine N-acetyltransferase
MTGLDDALAHAYLERLGVDARRGEVDAGMLATLQRAHLGTAVYANIDIVRGQPPAIDPVGCARRVIAGRGGYCFHLNGAFSILLEWLGVDLTRHVSGVQGRYAADPPGPNGNHLGLTTAFACNGGSERWLVDVGLGDGPPEPLPLVEGVYEQDGFVFHLEHSPLAPRGWRLHHDPRGAFVLVDFGAPPAVTADFEDMHLTLSTSADSGFVKTAVAARRPSSGALELLRGCVFTRIDADGEQSREIDTEDEWWGLVLDHFGLAYGDLTAQDRAELWTKVRAAHDEREAVARS